MRVSTPVTNILAGTVLLLLKRLELLHLLGNRI